MKSDTIVAIFLIAMFSMPTWANAQKVYKCGELYSQTPCTGGVPVDADDARTSAQKTAAAAAASRDGRTAAQMEKARVRQEKTSLKANSAPAQPSKAAAAPAPAASQAKAETGHKRLKADSNKKKTDPAIFTAQATNPQKAASGDPAGVKSSAARPAP